MEQYAVVNYDCRPNEDIQIQIKYMTDNYDYANKLAFHYAKKGLPSRDYYSHHYRCKVLKNYYHECNPVYIHDVIVEYRICKLKLDNECKEYKKYDITDVYNDVWAVIKIYNNITENIEEIDEMLLYKDIR